MCVYEYKYYYKIIISYWSEKFGRRMLYQNV